MSYNNISSVQIASASPHPSLPTIQEKPRGCETHSLSSVWRIFALESDHQGLIIHFSLNSMQTVLMIFSDERGKDLQLTNSKHLKDIQMVSEFIFILLLAVYPKYPCYLYPEIMLPLFLFETAAVLFYQVCSATFAVAKH